ncbi:glycosyltransferase family 4 protein [Methylococcaceae bacterium WWC4]|nr:glycosyltransferase family 4 protein [Methylococcaceae bacterium WWC4]
MWIAHFANTIVGKPGNIGVRTDKILRALSAGGHRGYCLSRQSLFHADKVLYRDMGWLGHVPRALNAFRIYLAPGFNHRYPDVKLFEWFARRYLAEAFVEKPAVAHVWDACPRLMAALKSAGLPIVLDTPVAPTAYSLRIRQTYGLDCLMTHQSMLDFERQAFELADRIVAPSQFVADELLAEGVARTKIRVVEFGVDIPKPVSSARKQSKDGVDFVFVGNVNRRKGTDLLIAAWDDPAFRDDRLHLCGRVFPEFNRYLTATQGGKIVLPGFIKPFDYLQHCEIFVFPSWLEGSAKAVYEAMACGLPVIATHSAGSIIRDGIDGFIIDAGDVGTLRKRMLWFKANPEQAISMGASAAQRARDFSWSRYTQRILDIYRELTG